MPHLHEKIDFTVALSIVHEGKALLVDLRWWGLEDFGRIDPPLSKAIDWYCRRALEEVGAAR